MDGNSQLIQLEAENGTLENVEIAAGAIMMLQVVTDNIWGLAMCQFLAGCFIIRLNPALVKYAPRSFHGRMFGLSSAAQQLGNMAGSLIAVTVIIQSSGRYIFWRELSGLSWDLPFTDGIYEKANLENKVFSIIGHQTGMTFALIGRACFILFVLRKIIVDFIKDIIL